VTASLAGDKLVMIIFAKYALFYDSYYGFKDYGAECEYVIGLAHRFCPGEIRRILELGCGTGGHAFPLAHMGFDVVGVDLSHAMIDQARNKATALRARGENPATLPDIRHGDARTYRDGTLYDLCLSMFAVMGYLTSNQDFLSGLHTARAHLRPGGLFIFDVWYGPAVLSQRPEPRLQESEKGSSKILRVVTPELDPYRQVTRVRYRIIEIEGDVVKAQAEETHEMRFFFAQELGLFLEAAGFEFVTALPFMGPEREPGLDDWNVCVVARSTGGGSPP
jgi:SAM-dependent methyltransferase